MTQLQATRKYWNIRNVQGHCIFEILESNTSASSKYPTADAIKYADVIASEINRNTEDEDDKIDKTEEDGDVEVISSHETDKVISSSEPNTEEHGDEIELNGFDIDSAIVQRHGRVYITTLTELFRTSYFVPGLVFRAKTMTCYTVTQQRRQNLDSRNIFHPLRDLLKHESYCQH